MSIVGFILTGVFSSIAASALFLWYLIKMRPNIEISPCIAMTKEEGGKPVYRLKIVNRTPRPIINVHCQLLVTQGRTVPGGIMLTGKQIKLTQDHVFQIPKFDVKEKDAHYARRFICREDIDSLWQDESGSYLRFVIMATDSFTGFSRVFSQEFHTKRNCLVEGSHKFGNSLDIA